MLRPFIVLLLCCNAFGSDNVPVKQSKDGTVYYGSTNLADVRVELKTPVVYLLKEDKQAIFFGLASVSLKRDGRIAEYVGGVFKVNDKPVEVRMLSESNTLRAEKTGDLGTQYTFTKEGLEQIVVRVGDQSFKIPIPVQRLDFRSGDPAKVLIEKYGFPTSRKKIFVSWPDLETHDDVIYNPDAGSPDSVEHWKFEKLPHAVFVIRSERVAAVHSFARDWSLQEALKDDWFPKANDIPADEPEPKADDVPPEFPTWSGRDGSTVVGKFKLLSKGEVVLETPEGKRLRINISKFKETDAAKIRELQKEAAKKPN